MNPELLEEVLACPSLPSLPAVAVEVIELTSDPDVKMSDLARTIQNDQALSAKILRTVNSSFYGLRERVATIEKALVMLGLGPVKSLALGFSLVSSIDAIKDPKFDFVAYWRRGLYSAVGARAVATSAGLHSADEAFLSGLLQDIGMVALYKALGDDYLRLINHTEGDHSKLLRLEIETFEIQHPDIGAMLAGRWRLPDELSVPVKYHERPTAGPKQHSEVIRCVALGNMIHDVLTDEDPAPATRKIYGKAKSWFNIDAGQVDEIIKTAGAGVKELANVFNVDTGVFQDPEEVMEEADRRLLAMSKTMPGALSYSASQVAAGFDDAVFTRNDPLTGTLSREGFGLLLEKAFSAVQRNVEGGTTFSLVQVAVERLKEIEHVSGEVARDEALIGIAALMNKHFEPMGGVNCRVGPSVFISILPETDQVSAQRSAEEFCKQVPPASVRWFEEPGEGHPTLSCSIGVAAVHRANVSLYPQFNTVLAAVTNATQAARAEGGGRVRVFVPESSAA